MPVTLLYMLFFSVSGSERNKGREGGKKRNSIYIQLTIVKDVSQYG